MKQIVINIPDNKYLAFLSHIKNKFSDIQIKEKKTKVVETIDEENTYETMLLSEESLSEDWLSDEDNRWDKVL